MSKLEPFLWNLDDIGKGLEALVAAAGLPMRSVALPPFEPDLRWVERAATVVGLELETVDCPLDEVKASLRTLHPGIVAFEDGRLLLVVEGKRRRLTLLDRQRNLITLSTSKIESELDILFDKTKPIPNFLTVLPNAQQLYGRALIESGSNTVITVMSLRVASNTSLRSEFDHERVARRASWLLLLTVVQAMIVTLATLALGDLALNGRVDRARIVGWTLALVVQALLQGFLSIRLGMLNLQLGAALKRRLLDGSLLLEPDSVRQVGVGTNLSTTAEAATIDQLSITDLVGIFATLTTFVTALVFLVSLDPVATLSIILISATQLVLLGRYYHHSKQVTLARMDLTDTFVERVLGHQTRLVQLPRSRWHEGEDERLHTYTEQATALDRTQNWLNVLPSIAALVVAVTQIRPLFEPNGKLVLTSLLVGLVAATTLSNLSDAARALFRWPIALGVLLPILRRATTPQNWKAMSPSHKQLADGDVVLEADNLHFSYAPERPPVLDGASLVIRANDKVLMTGASGGGKSTFAAVLTALRTPSTGLLLLRGLDQHTISATEWRRRVASAPQFHENYIFQNTLAFNLLMGRQWPAAPRDVAAAEKLCEHLGLGDLLDRMPAGIHQIVGETGWRLSHGERSRIFIARALLQGAEVLVFDENFGTLDPENLEIAIATVRAKARTLLVISHT